MLYAGIDIGGTSVKLGVLDEQGALLHLTSIDTIVNDPEALADAIADALADYEIAAAGVCCAGRMRMSDHTVVASNLGWQGVPFPEILERRLGCPVAFENDVTGALIAEWKQGVCAGLKHVVYVTLGTGVGGALLLDGKIYCGKDSGAGEVGHMITHADGLPCGCGGRGCYEQYASAGALRRMAGGVEPKEIFRRAEAGDAQMCAALDAYIHELCIGLTGLIAVFRPEMLVIGGGISNAGEPLLRRVRHYLTECCPALPNEILPRVELAGNGNTAGVIGGGVIAMELAKKMA